MKFIFFELRKNILEIIFILKKSIYSFQNLTRWIEREEANPATIEHIELSVLHFEIMCWATSRFLMNASRAVPSFAWQSSLDASPGPSWWFKIYNL